MTSKQPSPTEVHRRLLEQFLSYFGTAYDLREPGVRREVLDMLATPGEILQEPVLELLPAYAMADETKDESLRRAGVDPEIARLLDAGLFPYDHLYSHQAEALVASLRGREDVVVTTGTGSGKTESFLIPIVARLATESAGWTAPGVPASPWWPTANTSWVAQRSHDTREAAMRAMVLYPMNALVEDQLVRLRRALDSDKLANGLTLTETAIASTLVGTPVRPPCPVQTRRRGSRNCASFLSRQRATSAPLSASLVPTRTSATSWRTHLGARAGAAGICRRRHLMF